MGAMDFNTDTSPENPKGGSWGGPIPSSAIQKEGSKWHMGETQNRGSEGRVLNKKVVCRDCLWWFYHKRFGEYLVLLFLSFTHIHLDCSELSLWRYTNVFFRFETRHHRVSSSKIVHCSLPKNRSAATWADSLESLRSPIGSAYTWHCWRSPSLRKLRHLRLRAGRYQAVESLVQIKSLTCWMSMSPFNSGNTNIQLWHLWKPPWVNFILNKHLFVVYFHPGKYYRFYIHFPKPGMNMITKIIESDHQEADFLLLSLAKPWSQKHTRIGSDLLWTSQGIFLPARSAISFC